MEREINARLREELAALKKVGSLSSSGMHRAGFHLGFSVASTIRGRDVGCKGLNAASLSSRE